MNEKCNGYTNWDTWCLVLWINSIEWVYFEIKKHKARFLKKSMRGLVDYMKFNGMLDEIDFKKVNKDEVREVIKEL